uniref:Uncharacterized protein n=1 Tax=Lotus japonicus TaxID=34305 RepID=I3SEV0_LOTJA|nr:unknown [Lotus japonicus]
MRGKGGRGRRRRMVDQGRRRSGLKAIRGSEVAAAAEREVPNLGLLRKGLGGRQGRIMMVKLRRCGIPLLVEILRMIKRVSEIWMMTTS